MAEQPGGPPGPEHPSSEDPSAPGTGAGPPLPPPPPPPLDPTGAFTPAISTAKLGREERRALLAQQLQQAATRGLRVESQTDFQAVLVEGQPINHTLHAILTIFTCLIWGIVWAVIAATGGEKRHQLIVDDFGNVHWQNLGKA